jgi:hypothetical protein
VVTVIRRVWKLVTGRPWTTTTRSATAEYGPPPGAVYAFELSRYTDAELIAMDRDQVLREVRACRAVAARIVAQAHEREITR